MLRLPHVLVFVYARHTQATSAFGYVRACGSCAGHASPVSFVCVRGAYTGDSTGHSLSRVCTRTFGPVLQYAQVLQYAVSSAVVLCNPVL